MKFKEAVRNATLQAMEADPSVFLIGVGIIDPRAVWGTLEGVLERFGPDRVVEGPLSEDALTGMSLGAATLGLKPVLIHHRMDFVMLSMNQLINHAAHWRAMFGGQMQVPLVVRALKAGCSYVEVGLVHQQREYGRSKAFSLSNILMAVKTIALLWWNVRLKGVRPVNLTAVTGGVEDDSRNVRKEGIQG